MTLDLGSGTVATMIAGGSWVETGESTFNITGSTNLTFKSGTYTGQIWGGSYILSLIHIFGELGAGDKPMIVVLNKVDLVPEEARHTLETLLKPHFNGRVVPMSVQEGPGAEDLLNACVEMLETVSYTHLDVYKRQG